MPGPAALHGRRGRLSRLRRRRVVRAGRPARQAAGRSRPGRLHDVRHRAGVRPRQAPDPGDCERPAAGRATDSARALRFRVRQDRLPRARARAQPVPARARAPARPLEVRPNQTREAFERGRPPDSGRHRRRRDLPGGAFAALRRRRPTRRRSTSTARCGTSTRRRTCSSSGWGRTRSSARRRRCSCASRAATSRRIRSPARAGAAPTPDEDQRLADELRRNEKERAEHVMLVDLGRNDIGRVSEIGSVRVPQFMALERYSHVMHLVSRVEGTAGGRSRSARRARGDVSGRHADRRAEDPRDADHRRARADAARPVRRRRRLPGLRGQPRLLHRDPHDRDARRRRAASRPAPGIVADSSPAAEYEETRDKARALLQALEMANRGL